MTMKTMLSRFPGKCSTCGCSFPAGTSIIFTAFDDGSKRTVHSDYVMCQELKAKREAEPAVLGVKLVLDPIVTFIKAAQTRGLKSPKLRVLDADGQTELEVSLTKGGKAPGSVCVTRGGEFIGCVRPDGSLSHGLPERADIQDRLVVVARDPATAAKEYAALMGRCSFCGLELTDAGSVEVGYGPVCAKHWGLPHKPKGTPQLHQVPV